MSKVLVVDDIPDFRHLMGATLVREYNCEIVEAESGLLASVELRKQRIDLVVSDLQMPNGSGSWLYYFMREYFSAVPLFIVSANPDLFPAEPDSTLKGVFAKSEFANLLPLIDKMGVLNANHLSDHQ